jgi:hypothetical protein
VIDKLALARRVFVEFQNGYEQYQTRPGVWWALGFDHEHQVEGLSSDELNIGLSVLVQKDLIELKTSSSYALTVRGREACLHPEEFDHYLGPLRTGAPPQSFTINTGSIQGSQIGGHGNTQHVTYSTVLQDLRTKIETSDMPPSEKTGLLAALNKVISHPFLHTLVNVGATLGPSILK